MVPSGHELGHDEGDEGELVCGSQPRQDGASDQGGNALHEGADEAGRLAADEEVSSSEDIAQMAGLQSISNNSIRRLDLLTSLTRCRRSR